MRPPDVKPLQFSLTLDETNLILEALGTMPYARVYQLVASINQQAREQINAAGADELEG